MYRCRVNFGSVIRYLAVEKVKKNVYHIKYVHELYVLRIRGEENRNASCERG